MFCVLRPGHERLSRWRSSVRRTASKIMEVATTIQSGSLRLVLRRNSTAFFSIFSLMGITARWLRNSSMLRSSLLVICFFDSSSIRTIALVKNCAWSTLIPSEGRSYCWSSSFTTAQVSKTILVPFITDSPLICDAVSAKDALTCSEEPRKGLAVRIGGFFSRQLQGFLNSAGIAAGQRSSCRLSVCCRSKSKNRLPRRYFAGYVNGQPMVDRYINRLRNAHGITIA